MLLMTYFMIGRKSNFLIFGNSAMVYKGDLGFENEWNFKLEAVALTYSKSSVGFEIKSSWAGMGISMLSGEAKWDENKGYWESEWLDHMGFRKGLYKSKVIFTSLIPDEKYPDLLNVEGIWQDNNGEPAPFKDSLICKPKAS